MSFLGDKNGLPVLLPEEVGRRGPEGLGPKTGRLVELAGRLWGRDEDEVGRNMDAGRVDHKGVRRDPGHRGAHLRSF